MVEEQIQVDSDLVHNLDVDFLETVRESSLVDKLLHWIKVQGESLVFSNDRTPEIEHFTEWVLLESGEGNGLLEHLLGTLVHLLGIVRE